MFTLSGATSCHLLQPHICVSAGARVALRNDSYALHILLPRRPSATDSVHLSAATCCKPHASVPAGARVALRNDSYALHILLPSKIDPLVSLMKVEKVPDSTYDMIGGCDQQIKEIKEVSRGG
jgi:hypothetical protein